MHPLLTVDQVDQSGSKQPTQTLAQIGLLKNTTAQLALGLRKLQNFILIIKLHWPIWIQAAAESTYQLMHYMSNITTTKVVLKLPHLKFTSVVVLAQLLLPVQLLAQAHLQQAEIHLQYKKAQLVAVA